MNREELEAQVTSILMPVAPQDWLVERICNFVELYARQQNLRQADCYTPLPVTNAQSCSKCKHFKRVGFNDYECNLHNDDAYITHPAEQRCDSWEAMAL